MNQPTNEAVNGVPELLLLRHGEVASHKGDVPLTDEGLLHAERTGKALGGLIDGPFTVLFGGTRRTWQTAEAICRGIGIESRRSGPIDSFALRNPDMYLAGTRVNMVSSHEALAEQVPGMTVRQAEANTWWSTFITSTDRIGSWLEDDDPPGDAADDVVTRIHRFARSLADSGPMSNSTVVGVTHSPVLRAVLKHETGTDPGEPRYVTGAQIRVTASGELEIRPFDPLADQN